MAFTIPTLRSALAISQDMHTRAIADNNETMIGKWQAEIDRLQGELDRLKAKAGN